MLTFAIVRESNKTGQQEVIANNLPLHKTMAFLNNHLVNLPILGIAYYLRNSESNSLYAINWQWVAGRLIDEKRYNRQYICTVVENGQEYEYSIKTNKTNHIPNCKCVICVDNRK